MLLQQSTNQTRCTQVKNPYKELELEQQAKRPSSCLQISSSLLLHMQPLQHNLHQLILHHNCIIFIFNLLYYLFAIYDQSLSSWVLYKLVSNPMMYFFRKDCLSQLASSSFSLKPRLKSYCSRSLTYLRIVADIESNQQFYDIIIPLLYQTIIKNTNCTIHINQPLESITLDSEMGISSILA